LLALTAPPLPDRRTEGFASMDVKIKAVLQFTISGSSLEDALAEYDELTVEGLLKEIVDKAIAVDGIKAQVIEGPNTLEDYDKQADAVPEG
jgi:hypothetical protein